MNATTVAIADDHPLFRAALKQAVTECIDQCIILEAENFSELITKIQQNESLEIVFLDLHMPGNDGFTGLTQLQNHYPDIIVIMVSSDNTFEIMQKAIDFGAAAFIPKSSDLNTISEAIENVLNGNTWLPKNIKVSENQLNTEQNNLLAKQLSQLTPQQYTVLTMIADGQLNKQIAYDQKIKETTVKNHVSAILLKLQVNNRTLAGLAYQQLKLTPAENNNN